MPSSKVCVLMVCAGEEEFLILFLIVEKVWEGCFSRNSPLKNDYLPKKHDRLFISSDYTRHITSHHITSHHITSHHITSHHTTSHLTTSHHITSNHITSHHIKSHHITSHQIIPYRIIYHTIYHIISVGSLVRSYSCACA